MSEDAASLIGEGLVVRRGETEVLHDVSVRIAAGEIVAILGPNGAGKSTLLATLDGALTPSAGRVERRGRTAMIMQSPGLARRSVRANVEIAMAWWGVPRRHRRRDAVTALQRMRADHLAARPALQLSGGEQRRVHLARALAVAPDVLLLDEPFDGLDPHTHTQLRDDTAQALRAADAAAVVVLHDRGDAWAMADRIVVLIDGRVHADGPPQDVLDRPPTADVARFLGYDGELVTEHGVLLTRPVHVRTDPPGDREGSITHVVRIEDGFRVRIDTDHGHVWCIHRDGIVHVGDRLRFRVEGGSKFAEGASAT